MPIPDYQSIMLPLLKFAGDKKEHSIREAIVLIAYIFNLSEEERREVLPSGQQYIKKFGLSTLRKLFPARKSLNCVLLISKSTRVILWF